jgi:hypothetical protein
MSIEVVAIRHVRAARGDVFALSIDPARFPATFRGYGPIAAIDRIVQESPPAVGALRRVHQSDGVVLTERIDALDAPARHAYTLSGFVAPFSWLIDEGHADWRLAERGDGTEVTWSYRFDTTARWVDPLLAPVLRFAMGRAMQRCLDRFAAMLETPGARDR